MRRRGQAKSHRVCLGLRVPPKKHLRVNVVDVETRVLHGIPAPSKATSRATTRHMGRGPILGGSNRV